MVNDSILYSGQTSASFAKSRKVIENEAKLEKQSKILPVAKIIDAEIKRHREVIAGELGNLIHIEMSPEDIKATVMGLRLADQRMVLLQNNLRAIVKAKPLKKAKDEQ